ncbi:hypothetical protein BCV70DRAFT_156181 [Testicularia cyperi]|uniref:Zn(2)-C6 fungal-type domain-containing protein n=1 Tax=Testicularia cyperi TaxID=1882483 RepID=A0A317XXJ3_9BASI|nr:hypothetical protein BCV70DRAFT_156181 [Testicularia cyperi]
MVEDREDLTTASHEDGQPAKRKRIRIPKSCIPCLKGKRACDRGRPACGRCSRSGQSSECSYDPRLPDVGAPGGPSTSYSSHQIDSDDEHDSYSNQQATGNHSKGGGGGRADGESEQLARLQKELQEARSETKRLQGLLEASHSPTQSSAYPISSGRDFRPIQASSASPSSSRARAYSRSHDLHAARGLQMLAEMAGPTHQDANSNADKAGILHWSSRSASHASASPASPGTIHSRHSISSSADARSPIDRYRSVTAAAAIPSRPAHTSRNGGRSASSHHDDVDESPKNINGTQIYYGDHPSGDHMMRKVAAGSASAQQPTESNGQSSTSLNHPSSVHRDVQSAFNSLLDPSRDTFPFATIWSSGTAFIDEIVPFFPKQDEFDGICASFVRHFSAMCPALTVPMAINHARDFSRMSKEEKSQVSLPWLAVFLMICALGKNCDLESTSAGVDRKVRMLDAFLAGGASQQASRASSPKLGQSSDALTAISSSLTSRPTSTQKSSAMVSDLFLSAAYQSLRLCSFLSSPTLQTIHSQLLIGAYMLNSERAASFWPLLGSVARQAQSIGLHVDPEQIKSNWDPVELDTRRRLWWAVVHQDVILSGIFGRPLGITRFSCRFPASPDPSTRTFATLQCEFSEFARIYLDENQDRSWSQDQITSFTEKVLQWYMGIPTQYRPDLGLIDLFGSETDTEAIQNYAAAGVDLNTKGLMEVHQSGNLAVEVFYTLLALHRSNLFPPQNSSQSSSASTGKKAGSKKGQDTGAVAHSGGAGNKLNEVSLHICAQALRRITRAQQTMTEILGRARATMFWKIVYYTYQAAVAGAYIVFLRPQSKHAESALEDLASLTDYFDRMPERWNGLKTAKHGLRVLRKLAVAARENPKAASMPLAKPAAAVQSSTDSKQNPTASGQSTVPASLPGQVSSTAASATMAPPATSLSAPQYSPEVAVSGVASTPTLTSSGVVSMPQTAPAQVDLAYAGMFNAQSAFLPPLFNSSFMSPSIASPGTGVGLGGVSGGGVMSNGFAAAGSPLRGGMSFTPLVTQFNNAYDQDDSEGGGVNGATGSKAGFCYDPFIPEPAAAAAAAAAVSVGSAGTASTGKAPSPHSATTSHTTQSSPATESPAMASTSTVFTHPSTSSTSASIAAESTPAYMSTDVNGYTLGQDQHDPSSAQFNPKDMANYWSEYFSLQVDWNRLSGLV